MSITKHVIATKTINICFRGNRHFFDVTKEVREKIKSLEHTGFNLTQEYFNRKIMDCAVFISSSEQTPDSIQEGFIKVVCEPPNFREHMEPILVDSDHEIYTGGTTISIYRTSLEKDIWNIIMEFNK